MTPTYTHSRRAFIASAGLAYGAACASPGRVLGAILQAGPVQTIRTQGAAASVSVEPLRGNISVLSGSGGNIAVLNGPEGKLLVDAGVSKANVVAALSGISKEPVRYVVNSHWHFDHTDGNAWHQAAGATIVGHERARERMSVETRVDGWDFTFPPSPRRALPTVVLREDVTLHINNVAVALRAYAPAHTDTDVRTTFTDADVTHVGDTWWNGHYPFIDYSTGGGITGTIRAAEENVDAVTDDTVVIPGHGPVGGKRELIEFRDMLRSIRDAVAQLKREGRTVEQAVSARPTARYDARWGTFVIGPDMFTRLVYAGV